MDPRLNISGMTAREHQPSKLGDYKDERMTALLILSLQRPFVFIPLPSRL